MLKHAPLISAEFVDNKDLDLEATLVSIFSLLLVQGVLNDCVWVAAKQHIWRRLEAQSMPKLHPNNCRLLSGTHFHSGFDFSNITAVICTFSFYYLSFYCHIYIWLIGSWNIPTLCTYLWSSYVSCEVRSFRFFLSVVFTGPGKVFQHKQYFTHFHCDFFTFFVNQTCVILFLDT